MFSINCRTNRVFAHKNTTIGPGAHGLEEKNMSSELLSTHNLHESHEIRDSHERGNVWVCICFRAMI